MTRLSLKCRNIYVTIASKIKTEGKTEGIREEPYAPLGNIFFTWGVALNLHTLNGIHFQHNGNLPRKNGKKLTYRQTKKIRMVSTYLLK
jgi:hypothetical protein